jgi:hypothetical protein
MRTEKLTNFFGSCATQTISSQCFGRTIPQQAVGIRQSLQRPGRCGHLPRTRVGFLLLLRKLRNPTYILYAANRTRHQGKKRIEEKEEKNKDK